MALTRRSLLLSLTALSSAQTPGNKGRVLPSEARRYLDPATEFPIIRLTDPQFSSRIPLAGNRVLTARALLYASDISGSWQAFWIELKSRAPRQLTEAAALDADSLALSPDARLFWHFDGPQLIETSLPALRKTREVYRVPEGFHKTPGIAFNDTGSHAAFVEKSESGQYRLRLLDILKGTAATLAESPQEILEPLLRPRHTSLLYRSQNQIWTANFDGSATKPLLPVPSENVPQMQWIADGSALLYLNKQDRSTTLEQYAPETGASLLVAKTSQFASFQANANTSVIAGASGSKASPYLLLLIRAGKRELTLAEHRSTDPRAVAPQFSPNSQFLIFSSDRHGKPAIYWMAVDKLVSETDS